MRNYNFSLFPHSPPFVPSLSLYISRDPNFHPITPCGSQ